MLVYFVRRLLLLPVVLLGVTLLLYAPLQFIGPVERSALYVRRIPHNAEALNGIIRRYGLDEPWPIQYWRWLAGQNDPVTGVHVGGILRGDLGYSRSASQPVATLLARRFPATLELAFCAIAPIVALGTWLGIVAAARRNRLADYLLRGLTILGASLPAFVVGILLLLIFYAELGWFPPGRLSQWAGAAIDAPGFRHYTSLVTVDALLNGRLDILLDALRHLLLPVVTLIIASVALYVRLVRTIMLETLREDYIVTARAKGLAGRVILLRHAVRNALIPLVTLGSLTFISLLGGVVFVETVFDYPGVGAAAAQAAAQMDVITTLGFTLLGAVLVVLINLATDLIYPFVDPRLRAK